MRGLRSIQSLAQKSLQGVEPADVGTRLPKFEWVDPATLYVEEAYQRSVAENGIALIRRIYSGFVWNRFKPPICVRLPESGNILVCIDGQHTATACASHPGIEKIPVMVVDAADAAKRAKAFVGHNKDRLALTTIAIYAAEIAAGDPLAVMIDQACREAGATIPRRAISISKDKHPVGTTVSIGAIRAIAKQQGKAALVRVLKLLVEVGRGPIKSVEIAAAALVLARHPKLEDEKLCRVIARKTVEQWTANGHVESVKTGKAIAICVASAWCDLLGIPAPDLNIKGNFTDHARLFNKVEKVSVAAAVTHPAQVQPSPKPAPAPKATSSVNAPASVEPGARAVVTLNGVTVDQTSGSEAICYRTKSKNVSRRQAKLFELLARGMPNPIGRDFLRSKLFGAGNAAQFDVQLDLVANEARQSAKQLGLEVRETRGIGFSLVKP